MGNIFNKGLQKAESTDGDKDNEPKLRIVILSDTHNDHRSMTIPDGDILIHGGDWTCHGKEEHAVDFNSWLGTLPHKHKIVVNGNHENNSMWKSKTRSILSNAVFLKQESYDVDRGNGNILKIFGTEFYWPMRPGDRNPYFDQIDTDVSIIVSHGPVLGYVDGKRGCPGLATKCDELAQGVDSKLRLVIGGHIHHAYGQCTGGSKCSNVTFVNAANCGEDRKVVNSPIVIDL